MLTKDLRKYIAKLFFQYKAGNPNLTDMEVINKINDKMYPFDVRCGYKNKKWWEIIKFYKKQIMYGEDIQTELQQISQ